MSYTRTGCMKGLFVLFKIFKTTAKLSLLRSCVMPFRFSDPSTDKTTKEHPPKVFIQPALYGTDMPSVPRTSSSSRDLTLRFAYPRGAGLRYNYSSVSHTDFCINIRADFFSAAQRCNLISLWCNVYSCTEPAVRNLKTRTPINKIWYLQQLQIARFITW